MADRYFTVKAGGTYLRNAVALDPALSVDAVGLLMVMLAMHPRAPKNRDSLVGRGMGRDRVAKALRCLEASGLRYRFRVAGRKPGTWETLTLLFDEPVSVEQAWASIDPAMAAAVVACVSHPQDSADCVRGTETCTPVDSGGASGVQVSDGRKPVRPPKGVNNSSLRSELLPDHPGERADETAADCLPSRVERGVDSGPTKSQTRVPGTGTRSSPPVSEVDWALIRACVPQPMAGWLAGVSATRVSGLLRQAVEAGWSPGRVYGALNAARLPAEVANGPGLVIHRVKAIAQMAPPTRLRRRSDGSSEGARQVQDSADGELSAADREAVIADIRANKAMSADMRRGLIARLETVSPDQGAGLGSAAGVVVKEDVS